MSLNEREAITDSALLARSAAVLALVVAAFVLHPVLHYEPSTVALLGAGLLVLITSVSTSDAMHDVEWPTLVFFAGLFIMVGGLVETGVIGDLSRSAAEATDGKLGVAAFGLLGGSALLSAIVDNIPYVATMSPIVATLVEDQGGDGQVLWWALALGRGPRRQRHSDRRISQRRRPRARRKSRTPDRILGVHEVRPGGHPRDGLPLRALHLAALLVRCSRRSTTATAHRRVGPHESARRVWSSFGALCRFSSECEWAASISPAQAQESAHG